MLIQAWIASTGMVALLMLQFGGLSARRWAPFVGLSAQPAWIIFSMDTQALGVLVITGAYTVVWGAGCVKALREGREPVVRVRGFWRRVWTR